MLGRLELRGSGGAALDSILAQPKRVALLAYVALAPSGALRSRDTVLGLFWPEFDEEHARGALRQALWFLRRGLGPGALVARGDSMGVTPEAFWCDAVEFEQACALEPARALELYRGDLLEGFTHSDGAPDFEQWLERERARLRKLACEAARQLAARQREAGDAAAAVAWARRAAELVPQNEQVLRELMDTLDSFGDRAGAVSSYQEFARALKEELELEPSGTTQALLQAIRSRTSPAAAAPGGDVALRSLDSLSGTASAGSTASPADGRLTRTAQDAGRHGKPRWWLPSARHAWPTALLALVVGGLAVVAPRFFERRGEITSLAVLPLEPDETDTLAYLADGMTEDVTHYLSGIRGLQVVAPSVASRFRGRQESPSRIRQELGVDAAVTWRARERADTLVISADLIDLRDGSEIWGERYVVSQASILDAEGEIERQIAARLRPRSTERQRQALGRSGPVDPEAYRLFLRGRFEWRKRTLEGARHGIDAFQQAIDRDSTYARAYAGLADCYIVLGSSVPVLDGQAAYSLARAAALRAIALDSTAADAHASLGVVLNRLDWDRTGSLREFERAIRFDPNYATAYQWYSVSLATVGRFDVAIAAARRAEQIDPFAPMVRNSLGDRLAGARRFDEAIRQYRIVLATTPDFPDAHRQLGLAYAATGHFPEAAAEFNRTIALTAGERGVAELAYVEARIGHGVEARRLLALLERRTLTTYVSPVDVAGIYVALNQIDSAFAWLDRAVRSRADGLVELRADPRFDPLRDDHRFRALLHEVRLD